MDGQSTWETIAGRVVVTAGPLVAAGAGVAAGVPAWAPAALAATATAGVAARDWVQRRPWSERAFRLAAGLAAGAWTTWSTWTGPWHMPNLIVGAAAAVLGLAIAPAFVGDDAPDPVTEPAAPAAEAAPPGRREQWAALIQRIARVKPVTIVDDKDWPGQTGFTLEVHFFPGSGDSWKSIESVAPSLAAAARLPKGCAITVVEGDVQGSAVVSVPTVYALAKEVPLPDDTSTLSIWQELPIGVNADSSPATIHLRQASGLIAGQRGGGKTNLLKVIIAQLLRCEDTITWVADLNGGGLATPFMLPYAEGEVPAPPLDWVAATAEEVVLMARVAEAIAKDRKAAYAALTAKSGGDLLPVTRDLPQINIVVDESAEVDDDPKAREAMDALLRVQRIGRAEAVNVIFSALRATQDTIPVSIRKQTSLKLCGPVEDDTELGYMLPGSRVRSEDLIHPGTFFLRRGDTGAAVRQIKVFRILPQMIRRVVLATDGRRPSLDAAGQRVGGRVYAERMQRLRPWLDRFSGAVPPPVVSVRPPVQAAPTQDASGRQVAPKATATEAQDRPPLTSAERDELRQRAREGLRRHAAREDARQMPQQRVDDTFAALMADVNLTSEDSPVVDGQAAAPAEADGQDARWVEVLLDIVRECGPIGPTAMVEELKKRGISRAVGTLHDPWLPRLLEAGKLEKITVSGKVKYRIP